MPKTNFDQIQLDDESPIDSADAPDADAAYVQADIQAMVDLLNEIKTKLNGIFKGEA